MAVSSGGKISAKKKKKIKKLLKIYVLYCTYKIRPSRVWVYDIYTEKERQAHGFFHKTYKIIKKSYPREFRKITRMDFPAFNVLFNLLKDDLEKASYRKPIEPECRLILTLMFLSQGAKWQTLAWMFRIGLSTVRLIVLETCQLIWDKLHGIYLAPPNEHEWARIATDFFNLTGLPNCVGAIDGKHVQLKCPAHSGSLYYNYKGFYSVVLLAICDSNYCFTAVDIGAYGSQSDGGVLQMSTFGQKLLNNDLGLPPKTKPYNSDVEIPYYFLADAAFPLRTNIMRPYAGRLLPNDQALFNKTLSKGRSKIENSFGIMTMRWRVLRDGLQCSPDNSIKIIQAVVVLHNFAKMNDGTYCPPTAVDHSNGNKEIEGLWRKRIRTLKQTRLFTRFNAPREAFEVRDVLKEYILHQTSA